MAVSSAQAVLFAALSALLIGAYRRLAAKRGWVDTPNVRSSHRQAVPRGAGVVIVLLTLAACILSSGLQAAFYLSLAPGLLVAAIGWWDDLRSLPPAPRFLAYWCAALLALAATTIWNPFAGADLLLLLAASLALLWSINLYNFMDGINGLAAFEAIFVLAANLIIDPNSPYALQLQPLLIGIIAILAGFLAWNFPAAKVFMGDVGSAFLGFLIAMLALWSNSLHGPGIAVWLVLLAVFIADTGYTLMVRIGTGQRWYQAHRSHAYQLLNQRLGSHSKTVAVLMGVNIAWLLPWAWALQNDCVGPFAALLAAYVPLLVICYALKAGIPAPAGV